MASAALPATLRLYRGLSAAAATLTPVLLKRRLRDGKEDRARSGERRGISGVARPEGPLVWIHGASVGEVLAAAALIERLRGLDLAVLLTSGTVTSAEIAARRFPDVIHQYIPYDSPRFVDRFLDHWRPDLAMFIESDLWPNLLLAGSARKLPLVLINGRMSSRSFRRWQRMQGTIAALLGCFEVCLVQSDGDAERFAALGGRNIISTGNLKLDVAAPPARPDRLDQIVAATFGRPIVVAASTHPGEEEMLVAAHRQLKSYFPNLLSVIAPRHAPRGEAIATMVGTAGLESRMRSRGELPDAATDVYVADTMGELGLFYRLSPVVFMGGSLVPHGGQNPIEALKLDAAIAHGPHVFNFTDVYAALDAAGGAKPIETVDALVKQLGQWLANADARQACVAAGGAVLEQMGGALERTLAALEPYLLQLRLEQGIAQDLRMREPAFWFARRSLLALLLSPLGAIYGAFAATRMQRDGIEAGVPVMCVGNYHMGGAGKTPTVLALVRLLRDLQETPVVLSRGHGGRLQGPAVVDRARHTAADVGDEPLMMAAEVAVVIARDRVGGAALARAQGASVIVMDDGFQNPALIKHAALIVIDCDRGIGNGFVFPAGPLRAPLALQVDRSDALVAIGSGAAAAGVASMLKARSKPVFRAQFQPDAASVAALKDKRVLAFAGIGDPERFFRTLRAAGIEVAATRAFADHHVYTSAEMAGLRADADREGLMLVTTEKDTARLGTDGAGIALFAVTLGFEDDAAFRMFVAERVEQARIRMFRPTS